MDQLIIVMLVVSTIGAAVVALIEPVLGLLIVLKQYLEKLWRGPFVN